MRITTLLIDLDGTLYPIENGIWDAISVRMEDYMRNLLTFPQDEIAVKREEYYHRYGTTLKGLQIHHQIDPYEYLKYVHDVPVREYLAPDLALRQMLMGLPQKKWILTNSDEAHSRRILKALEVEDQFEEVIDIIKMGFKNKPDSSVFNDALSMIGSIAPEECVFVDDSVKNLDAAKKMGIHTVLVGGENQVGDHYYIPTIHQLNKVLEGYAAE